MFKKVGLLALMLATVTMAQTYAIMGEIKVPGSPGSGAFFFRVVFKGAGSHPTDSLSTSYQFSKTFTSGWMGSVFIHPITPGFSIPNVVYKDTIIYYGKKSIYHYFTATDTGKPLITSILISPTTVKAGDSITLSYRVYDNLWRVITKRVEISYDKGAWITLDSLLEPFTFGAPYCINRNNAVPGTAPEYQTGMARKYAIKGYGTAQIKITHSDSSGNVGTALSGIFKVLNPTGTLNHPRPVSETVVSTKVFNIKGQLMLQKSRATGPYVSKAAKSLFIAGKTHSSH